MVEANVTKALQNLILNQGNSNFNHNTQNFPPPRQAVNNNDIRPNSGNFSLNSPSSYMLGTDKIASIIKNWNLHFDGSTQGLDVDKFLYKVKKIVL